MGQVVVIDFKNMVDARRGDTISANLIDTAKKSIVSLLDERDFLGYQLAHAHGSLTDEQLDEIAESYLPNSVASDEEIAHGAAMLAALVPDRFDAELVSVVFRCELEQAARAIDMATALVTRHVPKLDGRHAHDLGEACPRAVRGAEVAQRRPEALALRGGQ